MSLRVIVRGRLELSCYMKDMKDKISDYCLEFIKKDEVKKELKNLFKPIISLILEEIYPYIYLSLLLVVISFFLVLGIFFMLVKSKSV